MKRHCTMERLLLAACATFSLVITMGCSSPRETTEAADEDEVNIGYGTQPRQNVTGSVSSLDAEDIDDESVTSVEQLLKGRVAGVQVFETPNGISVRIRGANSLTGSNEPLYVLDGVPIEAGPGGALTGLNPRDIESIEVLKDASAAAIYGSRGANGVVIITTKRGSPKQ